MSKNLKIKIEKKMTETAGADSNTMHMKYKIVFLGDQSVGKTSLILRFTQDSFDSSYQVITSNRETNPVLFFV
jgi:GTPase SAR1 family protein